MGLPKLKNGFEVEINDQGGSYFNNRMSIGDRALISGPGRVIETAIHEMRHHEKGRNMVRELFADEPPLVSQSTLQYRATVELSLLDRPNGTLDFLARVVNPKTVTHQVFQDSGNLPRTLVEFAGSVRKNEFSTALWDEAGVSKSVRNFLSTKLSPPVNSLKSRPYAVCRDL